MSDAIRGLAARLHHAYNPHFAAASAPGMRWINVAAAAARSKTAGQEALAAELHAVYVQDIPKQAQQGWPPFSDEERRCWLSVAAQVQQERDRQGAGP